MDGNQLFEQRQLVAQKLMECMTYRGITKMELSKRTGMARATLDRLLHDQITNRATYLRHIQKILQMLQMTEVELLRFTATLMEISGSSQTEALREKGQYRLLFAALDLLKEASA